MERIENIRNAYRLTGSNDFYDGMIKNGESDQSIAEGTVTVGDLSANTECVECVMGVCNVFFSGFRK